MTYHSALSTAQYSKLRGATDTVPTYRSTQYCSLCPNTTIFAARVNQSSFAASFASVTYDGVTTGAYTDIQVNQTIYLSHTNNIRAAYFTGRIRKTPTSSVLYINETSATITDDDYIFVIYDFRIHDKLAREVSGVQYKDYDVAYRAINPTVYGIDSAYAGIVSGTPTGYTVPFAAQAFAGTSGTTISSYAYTIPSGATKTAGDENTANLTLRFDAGFYQVKLVVTQSDGLTLTRQIPVWSVPTDLSSQVALGFTGASITHTAEGPTASMNAFEEISDTLDNTLCCIWEVEQYNGTEGALVGNVKFVGRLRRESDSGAGDETYGYLTDTQFELEGPGAQLQRLHNPLLALRNNSNPTVWDELNTLTSWRCIVHVLHEHSTFLTLHSLEFDSTADTYREKLLGTQGQNLLTAINELAKGINARIEFNQQGRTQIIRDSRYQSSTDRDALTTIANWTSQDYLSIQLDIDHVQTVGRVESAGGTYNSYSDTVTPLLSVAPGVAQSSGERTAQLTSQVLQSNVSQASAQTELNQRGGNHYAASNPTDTLTVVHPDGYNFMVPSVGGWFTWTLDSSTNDRGRSYTTAIRWLCTQATYTHDNATGTKQSEATYVKETSGASGQTVTYPTPAEITPPSVTIPAIPPFPSFPELPGVIWPENPGDGEIPVPVVPGVPIIVAPDDGNTVLMWTSSPNRLYLTRNYLQTVNPLWSDVSPATDKTIVAALFDPFGKGVYVLAASDGPWYAECDFTVSDCNFNVDVAGSYGASGFSAAAYYPGGSYLDERRVSITLAIADDALITRMDLTVSDYTAGTWAGSTGLWAIAFNENFGSPLATHAQAVSNDAHVYSLVNETTLSGSINLDARCARDATNGNVTISKLKLWGTGNIPSELEDNATSSVSYSVYHTNDIFADTPVWTEGESVAAGTLLRLGSTQGTVFVFNPSEGTIQYSDDYGATWTELSLNSGGGGSNGGGDVIPIGGASLFAGATTIEKAITLGGAYSAEANGTLVNGEGQMIKIPFYQFGSTTSKNSGTSPQYLLGATALTAGQSLWRVTATGKTGITPLTDVAYTPNGADVGPFDGRRIAVLMSPDGTLKRLWTSTNQGGVFTNRGNVSSQCEYLRMRRGDRTGQQLFFADGTVGPRYSGDFGATIVTKNYPSEGTLTASVKGIEPYG